MNLFTKYNMFSLALITPIHIWWCFNYPLYVRMAYPWNPSVSIATCVVGIFLYMSLFAYADKLVPRLQIEHQEDKPFGPQKQLASRLGKFIGFSGAAFIIWYFDVLHMSNLHYAFSFLYFIMVYMLFMGAKNRAIANEC